MTGRTVKVQASITILASEHQIEASEAERFSVATILIVDDHEVVRQGIRTILSARPEWEVIGEASNGINAIEAAKARRPDVVILDISMPVMNGLEAAPHIVSLGCRVLVFTMHESEQLVAKIRATGAHGVVQKLEAADQLLEAVDVLLRGDTFFGVASTQDGVPQVFDVVLKAPDMA